MATQALTSDEYFKKLSILYFALLGGQLLFAGVVYFLLSPAPTTFDDGGTFLYIVPAVAVSCVIMSNFLFKNLLNSAKNKSDLSDKFMSYQTAVLVRLALLEAPVLLAIVAYLLTGRLGLLGVGALVILFYLTVRPSKAKAAQELGLSPSEQAVVNDPDAMLTN